MVGNLSLAPLATHTRKIFVITVVDLLLIIVACFIGEVIVLDKLITLDDIHLVPIVLKVGLKRPKTVAVSTGRALVISF